MRNGSGVHPLVNASLTLPVIGTSWVAHVDATAHAGATHNNAIPTDYRLSGFTLTTPGVILGGGLELTNAIDLGLGP